MAKEPTGNQQLPGNPGIPSNSPIGRQGFPETGMAPIFALHRHSGNGIDGALLYGPYFIVDEDNGHTYKLVCRGGNLSTVKVK